MPIDSVSSASPSRCSASQQLAQRAVRRALRLEVGGRLGNRHQAAQPQPRAAPPLPAPARGTSAGATPLLLASPLMLTCRQTCSGGRPAGRCSVRRSAIFSRSTLCTQSKLLGDDARLVALQRADQVPLEAALRRSASAAILSSASCT